MRNGFVLFLAIASMNTLFARTEEAIFAGGSFWCIQEDFDQLDGVLETTAGFDGGSAKNPDYATVSAGKTDYTEAVYIVYNPDLISYQTLLDFFWHHIDLTEPEGQFCDQGHQYRSAIFYLNDHQKTMAFQSKQTLGKKFPTIATEIVPSRQFYAADSYHQNYYQNNPLRYKFYRYMCGRDQRLQDIWE